MLCLLCPRPFSQLCSISRGQTSSKIIHDQLIYVYIYIYMYGTIYFNICFKCMLFKYIHTYTKNNIYIYTYEIYLPWSTKYTLYQLLISGLTMKSDDFLSPNRLGPRFADMLFVETLRLSGYSYDWSKRKIHPLFQATGAPGARPETLLRDSRWRGIMVEIDT